MIGSFRDVMILATWVSVEPLNERSYFLGYSVEQLHRLAYEAILYVQTVGLVAET